MTTENIKIKLIKIYFIKIFDLDLFFVCSLFQLITKSTLLI